MLDKVELLERLTTLRQSGALSDAEFEREKEKLLASPQQPKGTGQISPPLSARPTRASRRRGAGGPGLALVGRKLKGGAGFVAGAAVLMIVLSFMDVTSPEIRWAFMTEQQLKHELLQSTADSSDKFFGCFQGHVDCDTAIASAKETYELADRVCSSHPGGNACFIKEQAAREVNSIEYVRKTLGDLQSSAEESFTNSL